MTDQERIDQINAILAKGITRVRTGDKVVEYDLAELRRERDNLLRKQNGGSQYRKVTMTNQAGRY